MFAGGRDDAGGAGPGNPELPSGLQQSLPARAGGEGIWLQEKALFQRSSCEDAVSTQRTSLVLCRCFTTVGSVGLLFYYVGPAPSGKMLSCGQDLVT